MRQILAKNLKTLMELSQDCKSQNALARRSKVAQTTIGNYLNLTYPGYPSLEKIEMLARCFGLEAWNLLHPNLGNNGITASEIQMYRRWRQDMQALLGAKE